MRTIMLCLCLALAACTSWVPMTNDEIIAECKKCKEAGLEAQVLTNELGWIGRVQCAPKQTCREE